MLTDTHTALRQRIEALSAQPAEALDERAAREAFEELLNGLNRGTIRAATPTEEGQWITHTWVKQGILLGFRLGRLVEYSTERFPFFDKDTYPLKPLTLADRVRIVPGGSAIRTGAYLAPGVICMPPMYVNVGAYVDEGTMIDSHALVGSCAQIGKRVHLSAAAQIGGVLEPVGARPVIIEDDVFVGGGCGIYEGCLVRKGAVLAPGVILTGSTKLYDLVHERVLTPAPGQPLEVPPYAVVVPGARAVQSLFGKVHGLSLYAPVIVKYRDTRTNAATALEESLR
ncbi:MAG: 2,3,4,5-tetrahydropyridine-2,6-dicarboxylate N-succinyltransferase [Rhodothermus sp.]|nr:2,3,4,5-tetrahydropyridine-2,6-dicarboxylate N-succinyltransferase [Rhodothermus sp.]